MVEVKVMIEGGKATPAPPLGPSLAPLGVNVGEVVAQINEKTKAMAGIKVPVTIEVNNKKFEIHIGSPPTAELIKQEAKADKGAANPKTEVKGNLTFAQVKKIATMKMGGTSSMTMKSIVKEIIGSCDSMGIQVEGKRAKDFMKEVTAGKFDAQLN